MPVSEQKTQIHQFIPPRLDEDEQDEDTRPNFTQPGEMPLQNMIPVETAVPQPLHYTATPAPENGRLDWIALTLGITALIMLLGLIPLWYFVYRAWAG